MYKTMTNLNKVTADISFDRINGMLIRGETEVTMSEKERLLFSLFVDNKNVNINKDEIINTVWGTRGVVTTDTNLTQLIYRLRRTLLAVGLDSCIKTVPRLGYIFISEDKNLTTNKSLYSSLQAKVRSWRPAAFLIKMASILLLTAILITPYYIARKKVLTQYFKIDSDNTLMLERDSIEHVRVNNSDKLTIEVDTPSGIYIYNVLPKDKNDNLDIKLVH